MSDKLILKIAKSILFLGLIGILLTISTYFFRGHINFNDIDNNTIGTFGDFIGGVIGTLFAIAATLLIWLTYNSQKKELQQTGELLRKQRFEDTFFNLLQVQQEIKKSISFETHKGLTWYQDQPNDPSEILTGDTFFEFAMDDFSRLYINRPGLIIPGIGERENNVFVALLQGEPEDIPMEEPIRRIKTKYKKFFDTYHYQLGHYFRHIFNILKFVEDNELDEIRIYQDKKQEIEQKYLFYAGIVQAQMSSAELFLMFYNGICFPNMNRFIIKYNLVENLCSEDLADSEHHQNLYGEGKLKSRIRMLN